MPNIANMRHIFVFGSNTEGRHGAGAASYAVKHHGAIYGQSEGLQGNSYAIITKNLNIGKRSIPLEDIESQVKHLIALAKIETSWIFDITPIGCGLAGYFPYEILPMFNGHPPNVILPNVFLEEIKLP